MRAPWKGHWAPKGSQAENHCSRVTGRYGWGKVRQGRISELGRIDLFEWENMGLKSEEQLVLGERGHLVHNGEEDRKAEQSQRWLSRRLTTVL